MPLLLLLLAPVLAIWDALPEAWHTPSAIGLMILGVLAVAYLVVRVILAQAAFRSDPLKGAQYWAAAEDADQFRAGISLFLRQRGWHVIGGTSPDPDQLVLRATKEKFRAVLLFLKPPGRQPPSPVLLDAEARDFNATRAVLVSAGAAQARNPVRAAALSAEAGPLMRIAGPAPALLMTFADLDRLDELLGTR